MAVLSYEVGAAFIIEDRASGVLAEIGRAFETLDGLVVGLQEKLSGIGEGAFTGLVGGLDRALAATTRVMDEVNLVSSAWERAATAVERYSSAAGSARGPSGGGGRGGGRGGRSSPNDGPMGPPSRPYWGEDDEWANAHTMNRNYNAVRDSERRRAEWENHPMNPPDGPMGPPSRPYWGEGDEWTNAHTMDSNYNQVQRHEERLARDASREQERMERERQRETARAAAAGYLGGHAGGVMKGMMPLVAGVAGWEAEKSAATEEIAIKQALMGINITEDDPGYEAAYKRLHTLAYTSTQGTKFSNVEAAKTLREALPVLAMEGTEALDTADKTFPIALRLGELSSHRGKGTVGSEAVAAEEFAHLERNYDPEHMTHSLDQINAIAMKNDTSVRAQLNIMKYGIPTAMMAGVDPETAAAEIGAAELRMGATSTAGTGYSQWLLGGMTFHGQTGAGQSRRHRNSARLAEREFEHALKLEDPEAQNQYHAGKTHLKEHDQALVDLGVYTSAGVLLDKTASGGFDENKLKQQMADYAATHTREQKIHTMEAAFQTRGARFGAAFTSPEMIAQERAQITTFQHAPSVEKELEGLSHTAMQQFEQMLANISNTGNILATQTLPGLTKAFEALNKGLGGLNDWLNAHPMAATAGGYGALGVAGAAALGVAGAGARMLWRGIGIPWLWRGVSGLVGGGAEAGAAGAAEAGAAGAVGAGITPGLLGTATAALSIASDVQQHLADPKYIDPKTGEFDIRRVIGGLPGERRLSSGGGDLEHHTGTSPAAPSTVTLTIHNTMNGVADAGTFNDLLHRFTDSIKTAIGHATEAAHGSGVSPYVSNGSL